MSADISSLVSYAAKLGQKASVVAGDSTSAHTAFPGFAAEALTAWHDLEDARPVDLLFEIAEKANEIAHFQQHSDFSDLHLNLFADDRVEIQLLFWQVATTSVHNHNFAGAFRVVSGQSLHVRYTFEEEQRVSDDFALGRLCMSSAEVLGLHDVRAIPPDDHLIHSVYHLGAPSITALVIAKSDAAKAARDYRGSMIELRSDAVRPEMVRRIEALRMAHSLNTSRWPQLLTRTLRSMSPDECYWTLRSVDNLIEPLHSEAREEVEHLLSETPALATIRTALLRERGIATLVNLRRRLMSPEARFVTALLMNVPAISCWATLVVAYTGSPLRARVAWQRGVDRLFEDSFWKRFRDEAAVAALRGALKGAVLAMIEGATATDSKAFCAIHDNPVWRQLYPTQHRSSLVNASSQSCRPVDHPGA